MTKDTTSQAEFVQPGEREYRKTATIRASQWWKMGDHPAVREFDDIDGSGKPRPWIDTLEGGHIVTPGDWIATGVKGEHWPIKPDVFAATYVAVEPPMDFGEAIDPNASHNLRRRLAAAPPQAIERSAGEDDAASHLSSDKHLASCLQAAEYSAKLWQQAAEQAWAREAALASRSTMVERQTIGRADVRGGLTIEDDDFQPITVTVGNNVYIHQAGVDVIVGRDTARSLADAINVALGVPVMLERKREQIARALNELDVREYGLEAWDALDDLGREYRYAQADAILAVIATPVIGEGGN